mmetsp:Transcript_20625/g.59125  ORF Transcript_20625/g.59125 Transcript_20625/m.59125 type:complete len:230 (+) Transcript_20625:2214-2903(+)
MQVSPIVPFPQRAERCAFQPFRTARIERTVREGKEAKAKIPHGIDKQTQAQNFYSEAIFGVIEVPPKTHCCKDQKEEVGMQRTDIVQDVSIAEHKTEENHCKIDAKQNPKHTDDGIITLGVKVNGVIESGDKDIAGNDQSSEVVVGVDTGTTGADDADQAFIQGFFLLFDIRNIGPSVADFVNEKCRRHQTLPFQRLGVIENIIHRFHCQQPFVLGIAGGSFCLDCFIV